MLFGASLIELPSASVLVMSIEKRLPFVLRPSKGDDGSRPFMVRQAHRERILLINTGCFYNIEADHFLLEMEFPSVLIPPSRRHDGANVAA